jgi:hypothetical protein
VEEFVDTRGKKVQVPVMFVTGGMLSYILALYGFVEFRFPIGVVCTLLLIGLVLIGWQLGNSIRAYRETQRVPSPTGRRGSLSPSRPPQAICEVRP